MSLSYQLKRKRDAEQRLHISREAADQAEAPPLKRFTQEFEHLTEWLVPHNLGEEPQITVWLDDGKMPYGYQAFGTSPFGGDTGVRKAKTYTPEVIYVDPNNLKIVWNGPYYGKVVAVI